MFFIRRILLLLVVNLTSVQLWVYNPFPRCNYKYKMMIGQVVTIVNPHWPGLYGPGASCRWTFDCPFGHFCQIRCYYIVMPYTPRCTTDKLVVSPGGDPDFKDGEAYCGRTYIKGRSTGTRIILSLVSSKHSSGGRFKCAVRTEPVMHLKRIESFISGLGLRNNFNKLKKLKTMNALKYVTPETEAPPRLQTEKTGKYFYAFGAEQQADLPSNRSVVDSIIQAIGLQPDLGTTGSRSSKKSPIPKTALESLLQYLGLKPENSDLRVHTSLSRRTSTRLKKTTTTTDRSISTTEVESSTSVPTQSFMDALIDAMS